VIPLRDQDYIRDRFARELQGKVKIDLFSQKASALYVPGREECATCDDTRRLLEELASLSDKVSLTVHEFADAPDEAAKLGVDKVPGIVLRGPANRPLRFFGIPGGNEFPTFIETIIETSKTAVAANAEAAKHLKKLKDRVAIDVYVTPTCPHCPGVVRALFRLALASAKVDARAIEINEFPRLAQQLGVRAVPMTVFNNASAVAGALDEAALAGAAAKAAGGRAVDGGDGGATTTAAAAETPPSSGLVIPR